MIDRHVRPQVIEALAESRAVALLGARRVGKSTLVEPAGAEYPRVVNLDDDATANAARTDPAGFVAELVEPAVIDEIQRAPGLLLAIKRRLDNDQTRGQFLLTGSANILTLPTIADALPGRVDYFNLWPFSQGELHGRREGLFDALLAGQPPSLSGPPTGRAPLASLLAKGGYPEAQARGAPGRARFFRSYVASIIGRDLEDIARVHNTENVDGCCGSSRHDPVPW